MAIVSAPLMVCSECNSRWCAATNADQCRTFRRPRTVHPAPAWDFSDQPHTDRMMHAAPRAKALSAAVKDATTRFARGA